MSAVFCYCPDSGGIARGDQIAWPSKLDLAAQHRDGIERIGEFETGRDKPVPYEECVLNAPVDSSTGLVGATLVVAAPGCAWFAITVLIERKKGGWPPTVRLLRQRTAIQTGSASPTDRPSSSVASKLASGRSNTPPGGLGPSSRPARFPGPQATTLGIRPFNPASARKPVNALRQRAWSSRVSLPPSTYRRALTSGCRRSHLR